MISLHFPPTKLFVCSGAYGLFYMVLTCEQTTPNLSKNGHQIVISLRTQICIMPKVPFCKKGCCRFLSVCKSEEDKADVAKNKSWAQRKGKDMKQYVKSNRERCLHVCVCARVRMHAFMCVCGCGCGCGCCVGGCGWVCRTLYTRVGDISLMAMCAVRVIR
jgi:hypothetical protein